MLEGDDRVDHRAGHVAGVRVTDRLDESLELVVVEEPLLVLASGTRLTSESQR